MRVLIVVSAIPLIILQSCQSQSLGHAITENLVSDTSILRFVSTMEQDVFPERNTVYAASLPLAWHALRKELKATQPVKTGSAELSLLDRVAEELDALDDSDYQREVVRHDPLIRVKAKQEVDLSFKPSFEDLPGELNFLGVPVSAFGGKETQLAPHHQHLELMFYKNDSHFAIKIRPQEHEHEVILFMADTVFQNFHQMYSVLAEEREESDTLNAHPEQIWRYQITDMDQLVIPKIKLKSSYDYPQFVGQTVGWVNNTYVLDEVSQSIDLKLTEDGVRMRTEASITVNMGAVPTDEIPRPKLLVFDKPFYLILSKADKSSPYVILYIADSLLLDKEEDQ